MAIPAGFKLATPKEKPEEDNIPKGFKAVAPVQKIKQEQQDVSGFQPAPSVDTEEGAFGRNVEQGMLNIGGGILRAFGELRSQLGDEGANKFLQDLEISQNMERQKTAQISEGEPIKSFAGEVLGETLGFPLGGGGASALARLSSGAATSAAGGGLSAAGRGESGTDVAIEAGIGAVLDPLLQGVGGVKSFLKTRKQAAELGGVKPDSEAIETAAANIAEATEAQSQTGIRTLPAQKSLDPFQLESQSFIGQNPEASTRAFNVLKTQNKEAATAVSSLLDMIASPTSPSTAPGQARTAAGNIVNAKKIIRAEKTSPIYKEAFREGADVDLSVVTDTISDILEGLPSEGSKIRGTVNRVKRIIGDKPNLRQLHGAKIEIDEILEGTGVNPVGSTTRRHLTDIQRSLVDSMNEASPLYSQAREEFRRLSPAVDEIREGVFGRIADIKDKDLKRVSSIIFDATESNPEITINAIKALKNVEGGTEIASGLLRTEIEKRLGRMKSELGELSATGGRKVENVPANLLNNLFGNAKQKNMLMGALNELNPKAAENAKWLEKSLVRASSGRPGGSQTGIRKVIDDQLRGVTIGIRNFFRKPIDSLASVGEDAQFSRKSQALGEALYNPDWSPDMDKIRKLNPNSPKAESQFEALLNRIVQADELTGLTRRSTTAAQRVARNEDENKTRN